MCAGVRQRVRAGCARVWMVVGVCVGERVCGCVRVRVDCVGVCVGVWLWAWCVGSWSASVCGCGCVFLYVVFFFKKKYSLKSFDFSLFCF